MAQLELELLTFDQVASGSALTITLTGPVAEQLTFDAEAWDGSAKVLAKPPMTHTSTVGLVFGADGDALVTAAVTGKTSKHLTISGTAGDTMVVIVIVNMG
jgi:hypothetical protein